MSVSEDIINKIEEIYKKYEDMKSTTIYNINTKINELERAWDLLSESDKKIVRSQLKGTVSKFKRDLRGINDLERFIEKLEKTFKEPIIEWVKGEVNTIFSIFGVKVSGETKNEIFKRLESTDSEELKKIGETLRNLKNQTYPRVVIKCSENYIELKPKRVLECETLKKEIENYLEKYKRVVRILDEQNSKNWFPSKVSNNIKNDEKICKYKDEDIFSLEENINSLNECISYFKEEYGMKIDNLIKEKIENEVINFDQLCQTFKNLVNMLLNIKEKLINLSPLKSLIVMREMQDKDLQQIITEFQKVLKSSVSLEEMSSKLSNLYEKWELWIRNRSEELDGISKRVRRYFADFREVLKECGLSEDKLPEYSSNIFRVDPLNGLKILMEYRKMDEEIRNILIMKGGFSKEAIELINELIRNGYIILDQENKFKIKALEELSEYFNFEVRRKV